MEMKCHEILEQKLCKELEILENKYMNNAGEMSAQDVDKVDKLYHALKSMATYKAMKEAEEYTDGYSENMEGYSGRRGRSSATGRYISRDAGNSYAEGYSRGYSEAMNQMRGGNSNMLYPNRL